MKESLRKIFFYNEPLVKIYPGHDEPSTIKEEMKHNEYYLKWVKL
jgi:glyoxylase-like metal-dependent hydrolase (beta-lactamase superfamily II)